MPSQRRYDPRIAAVLAILLGFLGVDRFYAGNAVAGVIKLLTVGGFGIWWLIDIALFGVEAFRAMGGTLAGRSRVQTVARSGEGVREQPAQPDRGGAPDHSRAPAGRRDEPAHVPPIPRGEGVAPWSRSSTLTEVVGEYYQPESYERIFDGLPKDGTFSNFDQIAALYPDPHNPHSSGNAVAVWIDGHHAGYLASGNASRYAPVLKSMAESGRYLTMRARVTGRFDRRKNRWAAEVGLELPEPDQLLPVNDMPSGEIVLIPAGRSIQVTEESRHMDVLGGLTGEAPVNYSATLHAIHEVRPRSSFETVEVRINGEAVGILSKTTAEKVLPLVKLIEHRGLVAVARAKVTGNALSAEVTLNMIRSSEAEAEWLAHIEVRPPVPRSADGSGSDDWEN